MTHSPRGVEPGEALLRFRRPYGVVEALGLTQEEAAQGVEHDAAIYEEAEARHAAILRDVVSIEETRERLHKPGRLFA